MDERSELGRLQGRHGCRNALAYDQRHRRLLVGVPERRGAQGGAGSMAKR
jgi:hypothetical protein